MPATRRQKAAATANDTSYEEDDDDTPGMHYFDGNAYATYEEMVQAKRERNRQLLQSSGLLQASADFRDSIRKSKQKTATKRGIKTDKKRKAAESLPRRKSGRIAGVKADGFYVEDERAGRFTIAGTSISAAAGGNAAASQEIEVADDRFFNDRINDGSDISVKEAAENPGAKWVKEATVPAAEKFMGEILPSFANEMPARKASSPGRRASPKSVTLKSSPSNKNIASLSSRINALSVDDESCVSKVVPDRIYSVACHPSESSLLVCAGDKKGHVGLWNFDQRGEDGTNNADGVHLFKPHNRVVTHLEWNRTGTSLLSASYDGSVRLFDIHTQKFQEIFATYDDDSAFKGKLGYGVDTGYGYWTQYFCLDPRNADDRCLFMSTSKGTVLHLDLRSKGKITFHHELSEKKINTVSLHPDGNIMATAGLDCTVKLWDIRKFKSPKVAHKATTGCKPLGTQQAGRSVNSAFFSPSGKSIVSTTMNNYLDLTENMHTQSGTVKATTKIRHDNHTGRWLSTFMAQWHPTMTNEELFVVGSMRQPRTMELFGGETGKLLRGVKGESLTAVVSRCCFHPSQERLVVVGGNSSGRVTVAR
mmetsp:Transcript_13664/g.29697  ORF Transcript_13664/g.29697 Transcript_13664/m.29697 type:complete len:592 (+) Transcript_13664:182-1957(+)